MKPIRFFDWWIYKLFFWRWNAILRDRPHMLDFVQSHITDWRRSHNGEVGQ